MKKNLKKSAIGALVGALTLTAAAGAYGGECSEYNDVSPDFWAASSIEYCTENGIMNGVSDGYFAPLDETSGEMAELVLDRIVDGEAASDDTANTYDTADAADATIERDEMAKEIMDSIGMKPKGELVIAYADTDEISSDCVWAVNQCAKLGFMLGKENNTFDPNGSLTRAELAAICRRVSEYLKSDFSTVSIIHTNDKHGYDIGSDSNIGLDEIAALKDNTENAVLVDDGDAVQGKDFASLTQGASVIEAMNLAGYDVMSAGNHEFDYGQDVIKSLAAQTDFPILSANTTKDGEPFFRGTYSGGTKENNGENYIIEVGGVKIGFFGILTTETKTATKPTGTVGITFGDETAAAKEQIAELKSEGADVIIGLFHVGTKGGKYPTSTDIAGALDLNSDIDVIIDGHSHTISNMRENGILIAQTGCYLANVGIVTVMTDDDGNVMTREKLIDTETVRSMNISNSEVKAYLDSEEEKNTELMNVKVADAATSLWGGYVNNVAVTRITETNLGDLICDAMIDETKSSVPDEYSSLPVVAVENGGGIRSTLYNGEITRGGVFDVLPFANTIYVKLATPKIIYGSLEQSLSSVTDQDAETGMLRTSVSGSFLQVGGMTVTYDPTADTGSKIKSIVLTDTGETLDKDDDSTRILLATNDYVASGGGDYTEIAACDTVSQGTDLEEITEEYILANTENGTTPLKYPINGGRIVPESGYDGRDYTASVYLKDENGTLLTNYSAELTIDNSDKISVTSGSDGIAEITLKSGAHGVKCGDGQEAYVDNISGLGIYTSDGDYKVDYPTVVVSRSDDV